MYEVTDGKASYREGGSARNTVPTGFSGDEDIAAPAPAAGDSWKNLDTEGAVNDTSSPVSPDPGPMPAPAPAPKPKPPPVAPPQPRPQGVQPAHGVDAAHGLGPARPDPPRESY